MRERRILFTLVGLAGLYAFFLVVGSLSQTVRSGEDDCARSSASANQNQNSRAVEEFDKTVNANLNSPRCYTVRAARRISEPFITDPGQTAEETYASIVNEVIDGDLAAAIKADPNYAPAYFERAKAKQILVAYKMADPASVLDDLDRALELEPHNVDFLAERASLLLLTMHDEKRGLEDAALLIKLDPKNSQHFFSRGQFFHFAQRFPEAIRDYSAALELKPDNFMIRQFRAQAYFASKKYRAALSDVNYSLADKTVKSSSLHSLRAKIYRKMGKKTLAAADEREAKRLSREFDREFEKAQDRLKKLQQKSPQR